MGKKIGDATDGSSICDIFEGYKFKIYQEYSFKIIKKGPKENVGLTEVKDIQPNAEIKKLNL